MYSFQVQPDLQEVSIRALCNGLTGEQGCHFKNDGLRDRARELEIIKWISRVVLHTLISNIPNEDNGVLLTPGLRSRCLDHICIQTVTPWRLFLLVWK